MPKPRRGAAVTLASLLVCLFAPHRATAALTAAEVGLLVNLGEPEALRVAEQYQQLRGVPDENRLELNLPIGDTLPRAVYEGQLLPAVRQWLAAPERDGKIRCLLLIYGMPLRVGQRTPTAEQAAEAARLKPAYEDARRVRKETSQRIKELAAIKERDEAQEEELRGLRAKLPELREAEGKLTLEYGRAAGRETQAALDSELALAVWPTYDTFRWVLNPLYFRCPAEQRDRAPRVMLTARLDAPTAEQAIRMVTDSVAVERDGLRGKVYLDARKIRFNPTKPDAYGYAGYDESIRDLAAVLIAQTDLEVVLNDQPALFQPGDCPDAALYCGWYSLGHYVDAFDFVPGAIGYHIASAEAVSLRSPRRNLWCKGLIEDGIAATIGPVSEPYTVGFPKPYEFFVDLLTGEHTLVEAYYRTLLLNSWMTTLIGDPLYNPFHGRAKLSPELLRASPKDAPSPWEEQIE